MREYLATLGFAWEDPTAEAARAMRRHANPLVIGGCVDEACTHLAMKLSKTHTPTTDLATTEVRRAELALMGHLFDATQMQRPILERSIGEGAYSRVFKGTFQRRVVAVKGFPEMPREGIRIEIAREIAVMSVLCHPNVMQLITWTLDRTNLQLVLPLYSGTVKDLIAAPAMLTHSAIGACTAHMIAAVAHCHSRHVLHRDIKPENVMVILREASTPAFVLGDFNLSRFFEGDRAYSQLVATLWYRAPELTLASTPVDYSTGVDAWATGCLFYELLFRRPAFDAHDDTIGAVHLHFLTPCDGCSCRGCKTHRNTLKRRQGCEFTVECMRRLLQRSSDRALVMELAAEREATALAQDGNAPGAP